MRSSFRKWRVTDENEEARFEYSPLPTPGKYIRLLKLDKHRKNKTPSCQIWSFQLQSGLQYSALSYRWGNTVPKKYVRINGARFEVQQNLWHFFNQARRFEINGFIWIDAICINQHDLKERNHQVQMMGKIFQSAEAVYSWLGMQDLEMEAVIQNHYVYIKCMMFNVMPDQENLGKVYLALRQLFGDQYWERAWIVQEYILAKRSILCFGSKIVTDWDLYELVQRIMPPGRFLPGEAFRRDTSFANSLIDDRHHRMQQTDSDGYHKYDPQAKKLKTLLEHYSKSSCADLHDRIYAFIGLVEGDHGVVVDYGKSMIELFLDVMNNFLRSGENLDSYEIAVEALEVTKESLMEHIAIPHEGDQQPRFILKADYAGCVEPIDTAAQAHLPISSVDNHCWAHVSSDTGWVECSLTVPSVQAGDQIWRVRDSRHGFVLGCGSTKTDDVPVHTLEIVGRFRQGTFAEGSLVKDYNDGSYKTSVSHSPEFRFEKTDQRFGRLALYDTQSSCLVCMDLTKNDHMNLKLTNVQLIQAVLDEMSLQELKGRGNSTS